MHEFAAIDNLVDELLRHVEEAPSRKIRAVRVRQGASMLEEAIQQAFAVHVLGTPLQNAQLILEPRLQHVECRKGHGQDLDVTELDGCPYVCPVCDDVVYVDPGPDLELLELIYEDAGIPV
jgi:Zn finger protein HypA/HybF involved in hydrogenase expression